MVRFKLRCVLRCALCCVHDAFAGKAVTRSSRQEADRQAGSRQSGHWVGNVLVDEHVTRRSVFTRSNCISSWALTRSPSSSSVSSTLLFLSPLPSDGLQQKSLSIKSSERERERWVVEGEVIDTCLVRPSDRSPHGINSTDQ
ncbi:hypothetical protein Mapa_007395 [Marchantia paleacea]|nr:hypothetical protein Mapa_007395 [Marchantia paleacea]